MKSVIDTGPVLLALARDSISRELGRTHGNPPDAEWLNAPGASFVTLKQNGRLRGCIGSLEARRPLRVDVEANALGAAFRDPRFTPLKPEELDATRVEVSLLSALEALPFEDEPDALSRLRPGTDGIVFQYGHHHSTFLPQVWDDIPEPADFLAHLKHKAGLPPDFWDADVKLARYTVSKWSE